jgi:3-hydroxyacyl-CoA dehydrogenase/enoyl-CoA hydratase/3-hydroxybutyryl-CoA epimerase
MPPCWAEPDGGGIAFVTATKAGVPVRIKDVASAGIGNAMRYSYDLLARKLKRRQLLRSELEKQMSLLTGTLDYSGFHRVDMVVEAVFEDINLKHQMVRTWSASAGAHRVCLQHLLLPIHQIASAATHPERVVGLHYFSPVDKMPLAEIIPHAGTSAETVATTLAFARAQGKTPIVVKDEAGSTSTASWLHERGGAPGAGRGAGGGAGRRPARLRLPGRPHHPAGRGGDRRGCQDLPILEKELGGEQFQAPGL